MTTTFEDLYAAAARWANDTSSSGIARAKDAVVEANKQLSYGLQLPLLRPWWRKREDTLTPVAGTNDYTLPTNQGTFESINTVWYLTTGQRMGIALVDDATWDAEADEDTTHQGNPDICNLHASSGTTKLRFSLTPSSAFIGTLVGGVIRLDGWIQETLSVTSSDASQPLMPESRRFGIVWKAVEFLGALQGDTQLIAWAASRGKQYYELLLADDIGRTGNAPKILTPIETMGRSSPSDYGH
jgi:hypothetical protein